MTVDTRHPLTRMTTASARVGLETEAHIMVAEADRNTRGFVQSVDPALVRSGITPMSMTVKVKVNAVRPNQKLQGRDEANGFPSSGTASLSCWDGGNAMRCSAC